eukprot:1139860-Pelagomonas_calceolata.AAC.1
MALGSALLTVGWSMEKERRYKSNPAKRPCAMRKGSLTSKLARVSLKGPQAELVTTRRKPEIELLGIWKVVTHAPGRSDSPPALHCLTPSTPPSSLKMKSMSGVDNSC